MVLLKQLRILKQRGVIKAETAALESLKKMARNDHKISEGDIKNTIREVIGDLGVKKSDYDRIIVDAKARAGV